VLQVVAMSGYVFRFQPSYRDGVCIRWRCILLVGVVLMGVEGRAWLDVVCMCVLYGVYFGCFVYIRRL